MADVNGSPLRGWVARVSEYEPRDAGVDGYRRVRVISATADDNGWLTWYLPRTKTGVYVVSGIEAEGVLVTIPDGVSTATVTEARTGTLTGVQVPAGVDLVTELELINKLAGMSRDIAAEVVADPALRAAFELSLPQFHGTLYRAFGHSFGAVVGSGANASAWAGGLYCNRLRDLLHTDPAAYLNAHVGSDQMQDTVQRALVSTWPTGTFGLVSLMGGQNDIGTGHSTPQGIASFKHNLRAFLSLIRAGSRIEQTAGAFGGVWSGAVQGPTWEQVADGSESATSGGSFGYTNNPGDTWTATFTGTDATLMLIGFIDSSGADFTVTVDGTPAASGSLANQATNTLNAFAGWGCYPVQLRGLSSGTHTVVVTHAGGAGGGIKTLALDCLLPWSATPPTVLVMKETTCTPTGYARYTAPPTDADVATFNGYMDAIVAEFPADGSIVVADPVADGWTPATMTCPDGQHPNDRGHAHLAASALRALAGAGYRRGLNLGV